MTKLREIMKYACGGKMRYGGRRNIYSYQNGGDTDGIISKKNQTEPTLADKYYFYPVSKMLYGDNQMQEIDQRRFDRNKAATIKQLLAKRNNIQEPNYQIARESTNVTPDLLLEEFKKGGIHIKKENRGKFTATAKRRGKGVQEFAKQVLANKENYSSTLVKRANFARNAAKWNKELGGFLQDIAPLVSVVPGAQPIAAGLGVAGTLLNMAKGKDPERMYDLNQMKTGGDFKQYNAPTHEHGGQPINIQGNPDYTAPVAEIEKQENSYDGYVFSDTLVNPNTGNTFAEDAAKVARKTNKGDDVSKTSRILQLMRLRKMNDMMRQQNEQVAPEQLQHGGPYRDAVNAEAPALPQVNLNVPLSTSPAILPLYNQLPTRGITEQPRDWERPYQITESDPDNNFYTVTGDTQPMPEQPVEQRQPMNLNPLAAGLKAAGLAFGAYDALRGAEQEKLQLPDYSPGDQYYRGLEIDLAPVLGEIDLAATKATQDVSNQAGGIGARNSRVASILARAGRNRASAQLDQQRANAQIRAQIGGREDRKAEMTSRERIRQQIAQSQNEATNRLAARKFFSDLSQVGTTLNNIQYTNDMMRNQNELGRQAIQYGLAILSQKYPNFQPDPGFMQRLQNGTLTEADKPMLDQLVQFSNAGQ